MPISIYESSYYLNKLKFNPVNANKYIYLSGIEGELEINENQWFINFSIYLNGDLYLPINTVEANIWLPFAEVKNQTLTPSKATTFPDFVLDKSTCKKYNLSLSIDTATSKYFDQNLYNQLMEWRLGFNINSEAITSAKLSNSPQEVDSFINELEVSSWKNSLNYTNYKYDEQQGEEGITNKYKINNDSIEQINTRIIEYVLNSNTKELDSPLTDVASIKYDGNFIVKGCKHTITYQIKDQPTIKTLEYEDKNTSFYKDYFNIAFPVSTTYDTKTHECAISLTGEKGIFIPEECVGYYSMTFILFANNRYITIKLRNDFSFTKQPYIENIVKFQNYFINEIKYFSKYEI